MKNITCGGASCIHWSGKKVDGKIVPSCEPVQIAGESWNVTGESAAPSCQAYREG